jgi:hypothetical protein
MPNLCHLYLSVQSELEHRTAKARYKRTDRKNFVKQLTQIERRQARIRRIRVRLRDSLRIPHEPVAETPQEHHHIGLSQHQYEHIGTFLGQNAGDPAVKVRAAVIKLL